MKFAYLLFLCSRQMQQQKVPLIIMAATSALSLLGDDITFFCLFVYFLCCDKNAKTNKTFFFVFLCFTPGQQHRFVLICVCACLLLGAAKGALEGFWYLERAQSPLLDDYYYY